MRGSQAVNNGIDLKDGTAGVFLGNYSMGKSIYYDIIKQSDSAFACFLNNKQPFRFQ